MDILQTKLIQSKLEDIPEFSLNGINTIGKIVDIYDGDTCKIILIVKNDLMRFNCRLKSIDTPEMKPLKTKPNRDQEILNAHKCRNRLMQLGTSCNCEIDVKLSKDEIKNLISTNNKIISVQCYEFDKYGRLLVDILSDAYQTKTINNILIEESYAKFYDGGTKDVFTY